MPYISERDGQAWPLSTNGNGPAALGSARKSFSPAHCSCASVRSLYPGGTWAKFRKPFDTTKRGWARRYHLDSSLQETQPCPLCETWQRCLNGDALKNLTSRGGRGDDDDDDDARESRSRFKLKHLVYNFWTFVASDPRDKVFAYYGLLNLYAAERHRADYGMGLAAANPVPRSFCADRGAGVRPARDDARQRGEQPAPCTGVLYRPRLGRRRAFRHEGPTRSSRLTRRG